MHSRRTLWIIAAIVLLLVVASAFARMSMMEQRIVDGDHIHVGQNYTLDDDVLDSLFVMAETIDLQSNSHITGDAALVGGTIIVNGRVDGDLSLTGRRLELGPDAHIGGDVLLLGNEMQVAGHVAGNLAANGGTLTLVPDVSISGDVEACMDTVTDGRATLAEFAPCSTFGAPQMPDWFGLRAGTNPGAPGMYGTIIAAGLVSALFAALVFSGLSVLGVAIFPRHIHHIEDAIRAKPRSLIANGLMIAVLVVTGGSATIFLLANVPPVGLLLLPVLAIAGLLLLGMSIAGMITLAMVIGAWLLKRTGRATFPPVVSAAAGSVVLTLVLHLPILIPFGGILSVVLVLALGLLGIGAALTTRMGTRPVRRTVLVQG